MLGRSARLFIALGLTVTVAAACSAAKGTGFSNSTSSTGTAGGNGGSAAGPSGTGGNGLSGGNGGAPFATVGNGGTTAASFDVTPTALQTITVTAGQVMPTVTYQATSNGAPVNVGWATEQGNIGTIPAGPASSAVFTPSGTTGGLVTIEAARGGQTVQRQVLVKLTSQQNGPTAGESGQVPTTPGQLTSGGGVGGVGGSGLGGPVTTPATLTALGAPTGNGTAQGLIFLYPYNQTVFPRGVLAPLLAWSWSTGDADAIQIQLKTTTGSFSWTGTFAKPAILGTTGKFINSPIPEDVWAMATNTAGGADQLTVSLTVAKGGVAYGPISETWTIAEARLSGTIYYNSYGTALAQNSTGALGGNGLYGGAVLSIHVGDTGPKLAAGNDTDCRVCHSVAAGGSRLIAQHGDNYPTSSVYTITGAGLTETVMNNSAEFPAMYPDGSLTLTSSSLLLPLPNDATPVTTTGLSANFTSLGTPAFSPDGTMVVFNPTVNDVYETLYAMKYDNTTHAFSAPTVIADDTAASQNDPGIQPGWPAFFPDSHSVVYHHQSSASQDQFDVQPTIYTRAGALAQIYWTNLAGPSSVTPLDNLNGKGYLPKLTTPSTLECLADDADVGAPTGFNEAITNPDLDHSDDVNHNYEPTVLPLGSGGYAWVVFTSRRMYGNVATIPPYCSDPRGVDLTQNITTKKLWVAAVDLNQKPGKDASHPAFYLPGQELLAGNSRAFWVLDPCSPNGASCISGDQCCNGYCEAGDGGALVCQNAPPNNTCSGVGDKCATSADCCDPTNACINGFCTLASPP